MLCNISISTINNNLSAFYKTNYDVNLFYPFLDRLVEFDLDEDFLHDEFDILLTKDDLDSIERNDITKEDIDFINEIDNLFKTSKHIEIEGRFRRFIKIEELN